MLSCCQIPQQAAHFLYVFCSQFLDPEAIFKDGCRIEELTITILHPESLTSFRWQIHERYLQVSKSHISDNWRLILSCISGSAEVPM